MKRIFFPLLFVVLSAYPSHKGYSQEELGNGKSAVVVSTKGYWVVESNRKTPRQATIFFYNNDNLLVYKKEVNDQKLKLNKTETLMQLKATLEDAVAAYENGMAANKEKQALRLVNN